PFEKSFRMAYSRTHYGTGYYIYHQYVPGAKLSRPIRSWGPSTTLDRDVLDLISRAGSDLVPRADSVEGRRLRLQQEAGGVPLPPHATRTVFGVRQSSGAFAQDAVSAFARATAKAKAPEDWRAPKPGGATDAHKAGSAGVES